MTCNKCGGSMGIIMSGSETMPARYRCHCGNEMMVYKKLPSIFDVFPNADGKCKQEGCNNDLDPQYPDSAYCPNCGEGREDARMAHD